MLLSAFSGLDAPTPAPTATTATTTNAPPAPYSSSSSSWGISPWLLRAASGGVTLGSVLRGPHTVKHWRALLSRSRADDAAFPRRLQLLASLNLVRTRALLKATGRFTPALLLCTRYVAATVHAEQDDATLAVKRFMLQDDPRWLLALAAWACHDREIRRRRLEQLSEFDTRRFREEMDVLLDCFVYPLNSARHAVLYLLAWETPWLSAAAAIALVLVAWHDWLRFGLPLVLLCHAATVLLYGAMGEDLRASIGALFGRDRGTRTRNILVRLRNVRRSLGVAQARMHRLNTIVLKLRSLYTWKEPSRTRLFLFGLLCVALLISVVPARLLFAAFVVAQFTRPLRSKKRGVATLALHRFWNGLDGELPLPGADRVERLLPIGVGSGADSAVAAADATD